MVKEGEWITCPVCYWNQKLNKEKQLGNFDFDNGFFVRIRDMSGGKYPGGKGRGFPTIQGITIKEALKVQEYNILLKQIYDFCKKFIKYVEGK